MTPTARPRFAALLLLLVPGCDCSSSHVPAEDGGVDAAATDGEDAGPEDAGPMDASPDAGGSLPEVTPRGLRCDEVELPDGRRCIEAGWFVMSRWSTARSVYSGGTEPSPGLPEPRQSIYLDAFVLDSHEVTNEAYAAYVDDSGASPPPHECGYEERARLDVTSPPDDYIFHPQVSAFGSDGSPASDKLDHPVVCVTRAEARAYCEAQGGRLPTVAEAMKAVRGPHPDVRRFAWGDEPPPIDEPPPWDDFDIADFTRYLVFGRVDPDGALETLPAGSAEDGASPHAVLGLSGNASELLADCAEDLRSRYGEGTSPLVRPGPPASEPCTDAVLVLGINWRSSNQPSIDGAVSVYAVQDGVTEGGKGAIEYVGDTASDADQVGINSSIHRDWGVTRPLEGTTSEGPGNERRSWRIGFRCAYDLE